MSTSQVVPFQSLGRWPNVNPILHFDFNSESESAGGSFTIHLEIPIVFAQAAAAASLAAALSGANKAGKTQAYQILHGILSPNRADPAEKRADDVLRAALDQEPAVDGNGKTPATKRGAPPSGRKSSSPTRRRGAK